MPVLGQLPLAAPEFGEELGTLDRSGLRSWVLYGSLGIKPMDTTWQSVVQNP